MKRALLIAAMAVATSGCGETNISPAPPALQPPPEQVTTMKIRIRIDGTPITATLENNATARDFASLLPLTLTLSDYASTEKVSGLPRRLSTEGAPAGVDPSVGDMAYYAPWGNLAIYYEDFGYSAGLIKLATIDSGVEVFRRSGAFQVVIEREVPR
jgi:hypothetical protein